MADLGLVLVELGALLAGLSALGWLGLRIGIPPIPLFLVAGLFFGEGGLWPLSNAAPFMEVGAEIGLVLLLLMLGMEFSPDEFSSSVARHRRSGVVDLLLNAPPGLLAGWLLGLPWEGAVALAGVTWVSSSGIVAQLLRDLDRLANRETPGVLSVLVLEDIAMAVYLPVLVVLLAGGDIPVALASGLGAGLFVLVAIKLARRTERRFVRLLSHPDDDLVLLRLLGITLLAAGIAHLLGLSTAVGAFLVGLAVPASVAGRARELLDPLRAVFASIFFVAFALATDPAEVWPVLPAALGLAVVGVLTKVGTGWFAAQRDGVGRAGRLRAGAALIPRGEFSLVIAGLAVAAGMTEIGAFAAAYVLLLSVTGPIIARLAGGWEPRRGDDVRLGAAS